MTDTYKYRFYDEHLNRLYSLKTEKEVIAIAQHKASMLLPDYIGKPETIEDSITALNLLDIKQITAKQRLAILERGF